MTAFVLQPQPFRRGPSPEAAVVVGLTSLVGVLVLFVAGVIFFGLAIAFPMHVRVADAALAARIADFWWLFAGLAVASFTAAAVIAEKAVSFLSPRD